MKITLLVPILIPAFMMMLIGGVNDAPEEEFMPTEITEAVATTNETIMETEVVTTETATDGNAIYKHETTAEVVIEPLTEPEVEPTMQDIGLRSLGTFRLTAYCPCQICCEEYALGRPVDENGQVIVYTASGARASAGVTIAVDPSVISYGTQVVINGHTYTAQDTGGAIRGNRIDVYFDDHQKAWNFGVQYAEVFAYD